MHQFLSIILYRNVPYRWMSCCLHYITLHRLSLYHVVLYCKVMCSTVLLCSLTSWPALYFIILYCTVLFCTILYCSVLYCTVLFCTVLFCTVLYCTVLYCTVLYCTVLYCTVLYCTVLYCTVLHIIVTSAQKLKENEFNFEEENSRKWSDLFLSIFSFRVIIISTQLFFSCRQDAAGPKRCPSNILRDLTVAPDYQPHLISDQQILLQCYQQLLCAIIVLSTETAEDKLLEWKSF